MIASIFGLAIILIAEGMIAATHGVGSDMQKQSIGKIITGIQNSPKEDKLPDDLTGCIIIYYKFGCPDCEAIYTELKEKLSDKPNVYWIASRSIQGKKLLGSYPVEKVPTGVYIYKNPNKNATSFVQKQLYEKDENNNTILVNDNLNRLLELQSNDM